MAADVLAFWEQIAGEELAAFTFPEKIGFRGKERQNGVLQVAAVNGAFALELQHREKFVLEKVNAFFGYKAVSELRKPFSCLPFFQSGGVSFRRGRQINQPEFKKILVSGEEQNYIEQLTGGLNDGDLKDSLIRLGKCVLSQNRK